MEHRRSESHNSHGSANKGKGHGHGHGEGHHHGHHAHHAHEPWDIPRPQLRRGWSGKVVLENQTLGANDKSAISNISQSGLMQLANDLPQNSFCERLDMRYNALGPEDAILMSEGLQSNKGLVALQMQVNEIKDEGTAALCDALIQQAQMQEEALNEMREAAATAAAAAARGGRRGGVAAQNHIVRVVEELNLCSNEIGDDGAAAIAEWMHTPSARPKIVLLRQNRIGPVGVGKIAKALPQCGCLTTLALGLNDVGDEGAQSLADGMMDNFSLTHLDLGANGIGSDGCRHFGQMLADNHVLKRLDLRINRIRDDGCGYLMEALLENTTLKELDLSSNSIRDGSVAAIGDMLLHNHSLHRFYLEDNFITDTSGEEYLRLMRMNPGLELHHFELRHNEMSHTMQFMVETLVKTNLTEMMKRAEKEAQENGGHGRADSKLRRGSHRHGSRGKHGSHDRHGSKHSKNSDDHEHRKHSHHKASRNPSKLVDDNIPQERRASRQISKEPLPNFQKEPVPPVPAILAETLQKESRPESS